MESGGKTKRRDGLLTRHVDILMHLFFLYLSGDEIAELQHDVEGPSLILCIIQGLSLK